MRPWAGPSAGDTVGRHGDTAQNRAHQCSATSYTATPVPGRLAAEKGPEAVHSRHIARNAGPPICLIALPSPRLIARLSPGAGSRSCPNVLLHCSSDPSCPVVHAAALLTYIQGPHHVRDFARPPQKNSHRPLPLSNRTSRPAWNNRSEISRTPNQRPVLLMREDPGKYTRKTSPDSSQRLKGPQLIHA
jgi:hypothetical protein